MFYTMFTRYVMRAQLSWLEQLTLNQWVQGSNPCARTKKTKTPKWEFFVFQRSKGENTGERVRQGREADGSTPVRRKAERERSGKANPCARANTKKPSFNGRFLCMQAYFYARYFISSMTIFHTIWWLKSYIYKQKLAFYS